MFTKSNGGTYERLITGASRGIGLELTRCALSSSHSVIALARKANSDLEKLKAEHKGLIVFEGDVEDPELPAKLLKKMEAWSSLDILINNAGIYPKGDSPEDFAKGFSINAVAPYRLTSGLATKLKASAQPKVAQITSQMGSIADNSSGGHYAYRASKAALNMINKSLAVDHPWMNTVVVHPGWVKTDMGGPGAPLEASQSAKGIWSLIQELKPSASGSFFDYRGRPLTW